ncbi:MAG TPA: hypothetical protein VIV83_03175 [Gemmatimonadales bacterium]|jgi:hypothetical protein
MSEQSDVAAEVADRLQRRGIDVTSTERSDDLADLLSAVERFEAAVEAHGGDLMVDDLKSAQPDDAHFVLPKRSRNESIRGYINRVDAATVSLRGHPPRPD